MGRFFGKQVKPGADPHIVYWINVGALHVLLHGVYRQVQSTGFTPAQAIEVVVMDAKRGMLMGLPDDYSAVAHASHVSMCFTNEILSHVVDPTDIKSWYVGLSNTSEAQVISSSRRMLDKKQLMWTVDTSSLNVLGTHEEWSVIPFQTFEAAEKEYKKLIRESETHLLIKGVPLDELDYRRSEVAAQKLAFRLCTEWSCLSEDARLRRMRQSNEERIRMIGKLSKPQPTLPPIVSGEDHLSDSELANLLRKARA